MFNTAQLVLIKWGKNKKYFESLGYTFTKIGDEFLIKASHLSKGSKYRIEVTCDYCEEKYYPTYNSYLKLKRNNVVEKDCCSKTECVTKKKDEKSILIYGNKSNKFTNEDIIKKFDDVNLKLLNVDDYENASTPMICECKSNPNHIVKITLNNATSSGRGCKYCSWDKLSEKFRKYSLEDVRSIFSNLGFQLLSKEYKAQNHKAIYICDKHPEHVQNTSFINVFLGGGCKYCHYEKLKGENNSSWKGGITPIHNYLRSKINSWKVESIKKCGYKCVVTGEEFNAIHHLYGFNMIIEEIFSNLNIMCKEIISDYSEDELFLIEQECLRLHDKYGLGVCLREDIHKEFHSIYGYGNNTPEQFEEFKNNYINNKEVELVC